MLSALLIRVGTEVLHSVMGGLSLFCLYYSGQVPDFNTARNLYFEALKWGAFALIVLYGKLRYLDK